MVPFAVLARRLRAVAISAHAILVAGYSARAWASQSVAIARCNAQPQNKQRAHTTQEIPCRKDY